MQGIMHVVHYSVRAIPLRWNSEDQLAGIAGIAGFDSAAPGSGSAIFRSVVSIQPGEILVPRTRRALKQSPQIRRLP